MKQWQEIRHRVLKQGVSKRQILRETGMHWQTLEKILEHSSPPGYCLARCTIYARRPTPAMLDAGVSQQAAMQVLGHATAMVNTNYYTGRLANQQRAVVDAIPSAG